VVCAHVASVCRTAEAVRDISRAIVSTTPTCARYNLYLVVVTLTYLAQLTKTTGSYRFIPTTVYWFQACTRKRRRPLFTRPIDNIVNEVQLPTSPEDTSFHHFLHRNAEVIDKIVCEHVERHGYTSCTDNSFFPFLLSPSYNQTQIVVVMCLCLTDLYVS